MVWVSPASTFLVLCSFSVLTVNAQTTFSTNLVLHKSRVTWQAASNRCRDIHANGRLLTVDTLAKADLLRQLWTRNPWQAQAVDEYWTGLYKADLSGGDFTWTGQCSPLGDWSNWAEAEVNRTDGRCARVRVADDKWTLHNCTETAAFVCEIPTEDQCVFDGLTLATVPTASSFPDKKIFVIREFMNNSLCDVECLTAVYNELECWLWRMDGQFCMMYLANSTILLDTVANATIHAFIKICFTASLSTDSIILTGPNDIVVIPDDCPVTKTSGSLSTTDSTSTVAIATSSTIQQITTTTTTTQLDTTTSPSTSSSTSYVTSTAIDPTTTSTNQAVTTESTQTKTTTRETDLSLNAVASDPQIVTIDFPDVASTMTATTPAKKRVVASICECFCESSPISLPAPTLSPEEKQEFVIQIVQSLTLNRSEISSIRRKFISVRDTRQSARNVGILGISLLSLVFGGIFILDIHGLIRDGKTLFGNVKSGLGYTDVSETYHLKAGEKHIRLHQGKPGLL